MSRRRLKPDELELWQAVARTATPALKPRKIAPEVKPAPKSPLVKSPKAVQPFTIGSSARQGETRDMAPTLADHLASAPVKMDSKSFKHMRRGKLKPEGRIDLHGMTVAQAHPALNSFILSAHGAGKRLVLVITGKGGRRMQEGSFAPERMGALKRQVPHWLTQAPLNGVVMQVSEAHLRHGGSGAYYVYLRRAR